MNARLTDDDRNRLHLFRGAVRHSLGMEGFAMRMALQSLRASITKDPNSEAFLIAYNEEIDRAFPPVVPLSAGEARERLGAWARSHCTNWPNRSCADVNDAAGREFDAWLAEERRAAKEQAWDEAISEASKQGTIQEPENPYREDDA